MRDWEDMRHVWNHTFYDKLKIDPKHSKAHHHHITSHLTLRITHHIPHITSLMPIAYCGCRSC